MRYIIREKFFRLGEDSTIMNEAGQPVFEVDGKVLSLHDRLIVYSCSKSDPVISRSSGPGMSTVKRSTKGLKKCLRNVASVSPPRLIS